MGVIEPPRIPRIFDTMPPAEARAIFEWYVADQSTQAAALVDEVRRRGGPADELDFSVESPQQLWRWFIRAHSSRRWFRSPHRMPRRPYAEAELPIIDQAPWWAAFHPGFDRELGPLLAWTVTRMSAYYFECALRASPASRWAMGRGRSYAFYQQPVFQLKDRGERPYSSPIVSALQGLRRERGMDKPEVLRRSLERWLGLDPAYEAEMAALSRPLPAYSIITLARGEHPRFTHEISFDHVVAHRQSGRLDRLVERLAHLPEVNAAVREDREVVLLEAPAINDAALEQAVRDAWHKAQRIARRA